MKLYSAFWVVALVFSSYAFSVVEISPYRDAQLVKSKLQENIAVDIPLGKISRSGRGWEPDVIRTVNGDEFSSLYKINRNALLSDVYSYYRSQLLLNGAQIVFECQSRGCGSSNAWANNFFKDYLLYGSDHSQHLLVVENMQGIYSILYLNRRGAGDVMVRLDTVTTANISGSESDVVAQMAVEDLPRIRRFLNDLPSDKRVVAFVTSNGDSGKTAIQNGDALISTVVTGLGRNLAGKVRFINLADMGRESLGENQISFVYIE
ncbi:DUF4892 domain-containing protein [Marinomonas sp. C2222]|uniref:DUF4892 domain-containing protein n=1 Tax=Marinomonas sargassi TaxID=2984494 RepID=A0ABT2YS44_9GAMM|nr:DUF4892 domain-containing protein [Marinomonas sargassi]MCV2402713.1 DUF4892 domain-containing protein [Marinomonas sargassi]